MAKNKGVLFIVSAPSGTGKTTLCRRILPSIPGIERSVSCTTRPPREGEVHGKDYVFLSDSDFDRMLAQGRFAEWAQVYGYRYGTLKKTIADSLKKSRDLLLEIDVQGARTLRKEFGAQAVTIFLTPPSLKELRRRLEKRGKDTRKMMEARFTKAIKEIAQRKYYDYIIVNDSLTEAGEKLKAIILAERQRTERVHKKL